MNGRKLKRIGYRSIENDLRRLHRILRRQQDRAGCLGAVPARERRRDILSAAEGEYLMWQMAQELLPGPDIGRAYGDFGGRERARAVFDTLCDVAALLNRLNSVS
jgi:hypothetical protein